MELKGLVTGRVAVATEKNANNPRVFLNFGLQLIIHLKVEGAGLWVGTRERVFLKICSRAPGPGGPWVCR